MNKKNKKKWVVNWSIIWVILTLTLISFSLIFFLKNDEIQEWYIYLNTNCNINKLNNYINEIKHNNNELIKYYSRIYYFLSASENLNLNDFQIDSLKNLLKINITTSPWLLFPVFLLMFITLIITCIIIFIKFIIFLYRRHLYKKYYWYYFDIVENIDYYTR